MVQTLLPDLTEEIDVDREIAALARRYARAGGLVLQVLNGIGGRAEGALDRLPSSVRGQLGSATEKALQVAMRAAHGSRGYVADQPGWLTAALTTAMGAVGGMGGLPSALAELPITTTVLLRAIQDVAAENGFDPSEENVQFDCLQVFSAAGPLEADDGADLAFVAARVTLTGVTVQALIARVAPRLAVVLGQKLAAQAVPVLGAVAGAATNYAYTTYYQEIAQVHFGLRRLSVDSGVDHAELVRALAAEIKAGHRLR